MVVPKTNTDAVQDELASRYPHVAKGHSDWLELTRKDPYIGKGQLV